jgi:hypothetical protein
MSSASKYPIIHYPVDPQVESFLVVNVIIEALAFAVVGLRLYTRKCIATGLGTDDWLAVGSVILGFGCLIISSLMATMGSGHPASTVMPVISTNLLLTFILQPMYIFSLFCSKTSVLLLYQRVFQTPAMRRAVQVTMGVVAVWALGHYLAGEFICSPVASQYDLTVPGTCGNDIAVFLSLIVTNALTDIVIMVLPVYTIWRLQMTRAGKIGLCALDRPPAALPAILPVPAAELLRPRVRVQRPATITPRQRPGDIHFHNRQRAGACQHRGR